MTTANCDAALPALPAIVIVDADESWLAAIEHTVTDRYARDHRVISATTAELALELCNELRRRDESLALLLAADDLPVMSGRVLLATVRNTHPQAGRVLISSSPDVEAAILAANELGIHGYVTRTDEDQSARMHLTLDELLIDWRARAALPYLLVETIMDRDGDVVVIGNDATIGAAANIVATTRVGDLMVVDGSGDFVGVLSEGDILRNALPDVEEIIDAGGSLHDAYQIFVRKAKELSSKPLLPLIIREPITLRPTDHVAQAATILIERQIRRLPVVEHGRLLGTISRANICRAAAGAR
jgi:CBS domain-containing protein